MAPHINLGLFDPSDPASDKEVAAALEDLVNGTLEPFGAAKTIDEVIRADVQEAYTSYTSQPHPTPEQLEDGIVRKPSPAGWQRFLWLSLGEVALRVPADHPGQQSVVAFLQELPRLPRHKVPEVIGDTKEVREKELWAQDTAYDGFEQWMYEVNEGNFMARQTPSGDPDAAVKYLNFSALMARLLAGGVIDTSRLSALRSPSPFAVGKPLISPVHPDPADAARHYEPWLSAAAQWILHAGEALFELCEKKAFRELGSQVWTRTQWDGWKLKFEAASKEDRLSTQARQLASKALTQMAEVEKQGVKESVFEALGFMSMDYGDDDE
ncbi:Uncharacterized protein TPAR_05393 [Tolypocladium paradoxum]|uniref:Uncharacterized protein n=1 Tax=Tolypocladium paradoxum TaxID=94208 RepID=A0A2S4KW46_9HYPO|nr:Uncharacterized protein TPAR_05393 [Tolypocladium paradoxum]